MRKVDEKIRDEKVKIQTINEEFKQTKKSFERNNKEEAFNNFNFSQERPRASILINFI